MDNIIVSDSILDSYFEQFWDIHNIDLNNTKISINRFNSCMSYIYKEYIKDIKVNKDCNTLNAYNEIDILNIVEWYSSKILYYDIVSIYGLCLLLGIRKQWLYDALREDDRLTIPVKDQIKGIFELYQELAIGKSNDSPIGLITNINNNQDIGLMYNKQNIINNYEAKQLLNINDLPKLE